MTTHRRIAEAIESQDLALEVSRAEPTTLLDLVWQQHGNVINVLLAIEANEAPLVGAFLEQHLPRALDLEEEAA